MRWYLLRDRRHEGPYSKEQIAESVKAGKIDPRDYLLPEKAVEDQSSFAYISAGDVLGPEFIFDLKKSETIKPQSANSGISIQGAVPSQVTPPSKQLISEFEEGLESTQLFNLKKERAVNESSGTPVRLESFASQPAASSKFPWAIGGLVLVVLAVAAFLSQPLLEKAPSNSPVGTKASGVAPATAYRNLKQNRLPAGRVQLPSTGTRDEEPNSVINGARSEERAEPVRKRRKRKAVESESTDAVEDVDTASDAESFDEEDYVEEDESSEEDVDEADI